MSTADTMPASANNIRIPSPNSVQLGFDTECGNPKGNARSSVNLEKEQSETNKTNTVMKY